MEWPRVPFAQVVSSRGVGQKGLPRSEWEEVGKYPVIGQGEQYVEGRTDRDDLVVIPNPAVVVYGGHTRRAKYVNELFVPGPNVKLLRPAKVLDAKFLYWFLNQLDIPSRGYADHFPQVRRSYIPLPPLSEQRRIVEILDQADRLRRLRAEADAKADRILPALFIKMFGDPATNPMGWPVVPLRHLGKPLSGGAFPLAEQGLTDGDVPFIKVSDMNAEGNEWFIRRANNYVSRSTLKRLRVTLAPAGTVVFPKIGAAVATNKKRILVRETAYDNNVIGVVSKDAKYSAYLFGFFLMFDLRTLARSTALPSIKASELASLPIPKPSPELTEGFAERLARLAGTRDAAARGKRRLEDLFNLLTYEAFSGALTASWRQAHMKELLQEMEQQAKALATG